MRARDSQRSRCYGAERAAWARFRGTRLLELVGEFMGRPDAAEEFARCRVRQAAARPRGCWPLAAREP